MSERHAIFLINNIRLIRLLLTVAAILPVLIKATTVEAAGFAIQPTNNTAIGSRYVSASPDLFYAGQIGEVIIWQRALSSNTTSPIFRQLRGRYGI